MKRMERALSLAIDDAIEAMSDEPHARDEIRPDIDAYNHILQALRLAKSARGGETNEGWRGAVL